MDEKVLSFLPLEGWVGDQLCMECVCASDQKPLVVGLDDIDYLSMS